MGCAVEDKILYEFNRNSDETIYFTLHEYKQRKYLDLRVFFKPKDGDEMRPTRKGLTLPIELVGELKKGIDSCQKDIAASKK